MWQGCSLTILWEGAPFFSMTVWEAFRVDKGSGHVLSSIFPA